MIPESESRHRLRILHLSDLHERGPREREQWRRRRVLGEAWDRNLSELLQDGPVDLICLTGDLADRGLIEEYDAASSFVTTVWQRIGVGADRFFLVPGNHDVDRRESHGAWQGVRGALDRGLDRQALSRWMAGLDDRAPLGAEDGWRDALLARQAAFWAWVRSMGCGGLAPSESGHGRLGYRKTLSLPHLPFPVHVIGLDSAWLAGDDADNGKLLLTNDQVMRHCTVEDGGRLAGLRLALVHHPLLALADGAGARRLLADHVDLVLRGHLHESELETTLDPDRAVRPLASGCLYEGHRADQHPNAALLLTLELDAAGQIRKTEVRFRAFSPRGGHWHDDDSLYRGSRGGRLTWRADDTVTRPPLGNPYDPWTPAVPPRFAGREALLRRLEAAAEEGRSVSLVGDWRVGKSSVLATWADRLRTRGRAVSLVSGEGEAGVSCGAFVEAITGAPAPEDPDGAAAALDRWAMAVGRPGLPPVLLVDEVDGLMPRFEHRFFERMRGMLGRVALVLASRQELDRIAEDLGRTSPFHNRLELQWVGLLGEEGAERIIGWGEPLLGPGDAGRMRAWAGQHPFYLQLLGRHLVDARRAGEDVNDAMDRFRAEAAARLRELWRVLDDRERDSLREAVRGVPTRRRTLRMRGLVTAEGALFGAVLEEWLREEA